MHQMARSTVFISGMGGLGVEIGNISLHVFEPYFNSDSGVIIM